MIIKKNLGILKPARKNFILIIFCLLLSFVILYNFNSLNYKINSNLVSKQVYLNSSVEEDLKENIENQLGDIDFSGLENIVNKLENSANSLFAGNSFINIVKKFINGENSNLYSNFFTYALSVIFNDVLSFVPYFAIIVVIAIVYSLIGQFSSGNNKSIESLIHIVCFSSIAVIVLKMVSTAILDVSSTITMVEGQMEIIFPIILTLISAIGSVVTASTFQPILAVLTVGITKIFTMVLVPIFIFSIIFGVVGNLSKTVRMEKFSKFFSSLFNWIVGIIFTIFISFLTIQGLTVSTIDTISFKTAKFAIKSYLPLGSYLSDGIGLIIASSVLIKNSVGATGLVLLFATIFAPIIKIAVLMLLLKLVSSIIETLCNEQISNFLYSVSKSLNMLNICLIAIGFMYLVSVSILMCCSNIL